MSVYKRSAAETDVYLADGLNAWAVKLACTPPNSPAAASLTVEPLPCPGAAVSCPLADGATVFLGDTLKISPSVSPPDAFKPVTGWRLDYDFHPGSTEDGGGPYPRLAQADASGSGNPPAASCSSAPATRAPAAIPRPDRTAGTRSGRTAPRRARLHREPGRRRDESAPDRVRSEQRAGLGEISRRRSLTWKVPTVRLSAPAILAGAARSRRVGGAPVGLGLQMVFRDEPGGTSRRDAEPRRRMHGAELRAHLSGTRHVQRLADRPLSERLRDARLREPLHRGGRRPDGEGDRAGPGAEGRRPHHASDHRDGVCGICRRRGRGDAEGGGGDDHRLPLVHRRRSGRLRPDGLPGPDVRLPPGADPASAGRHLQPLRQGLLHGGHGVARRLDPEQPGGGQPDAPGA